MRSYLYLAGAILIALVGSTCLKMSYGFTQLWPTIICIVSYAIAYYSFSLALREMDLSLGYALWSAASIICNAIIGAVLFQESITPVKVVCFLVIVFGTILIQTDYTEKNNMYSEV